MPDVETFYRRNLLYHCNVETFFHFLDVETFSRLGILLIIETSKPFGVETFFLLVDVETLFHCLDVETF